MQSSYWFAPKFLGWGFMPITYQGWIATLVLIALIVFSAYINGIPLKKSTKSLKFFISKQGLRFMLDLILLIALFTALFADKVEGGLQWRFF